MLNHASSNWPLVYYFMVRFILHYMASSASSSHNKKISLKSKQVHESFLLQNIFSDSWKTFCDLSVKIEPENKKHESGNKNENKKKAKMLTSSRIHFATKPRKHKSKNTRWHESMECHNNDKSFIDQSSSVKIGGYWPRSLLRFYGFQLCLSP